MDRAEREGIANREERTGETSSSSDPSSCRSSYYQNPHRHASSPCTEIKSTCPSACICSTEPSSSSHLPAISNSLVILQIDTSTRFQATSRNSQTFIETFIETFFPCDASYDTLAAATSPISTSISGFNTPHLSPIFSPLRTGWTHTTFSSLQHIGLGYIIALTRTAPFRTIPHFDLLHDIYLPFTPYPITLRTHDTEKK